MIVCNIQNYWITEVYQLPGIQNTRRQLFQNWICYRPQARGGIHLLCWVP
jgi:hypothetical protein